MGEIISKKRIDDKYFLKLLVDEYEAKNIGCFVNNIRLFSLDNCNIQSRIIEKGRNLSSKYFLIPTQLKTKSKKKPKSIIYYSLDLKDKNIFIYLVDYYNSA